MTHRSEIAVSISTAPDRSKLGFPKREESRVLFTLCSHLIRAGHSILYSGDLRPGGYTLQLFEFVAGTYAGQGMEPFTNLLPEPIVRRVGYSALRDSVYAAQGTARVEVMVGGVANAVRRSPKGLLVGPKGPSRREIIDDQSMELWLASVPASAASLAYTAARQLGAERTAARISFGGKMGLVALREDLYEGAMPGIAEEAILTLREDKPYIPLAAFGGATRDVAIALGLLPQTDRVPRSAQAEGYGEAMVKVAELSKAVPPAMRPTLSALAASDRAEKIGVAIVDLLSPG